MILELKKSITAHMNDFTESILKPLEIEEKFYKELSKRYTCFEEDHVYNENIYQQLKHEVEHTTEGLNELSLYIDVIKQTMGIEYTDTYIHYEIDYDADQVTLYFYDIQPYNVEDLERFYNKWTKYYVEKVKEEI